MSAVLRGTTPTLVITVTDEDGNTVDLSDVAVCRLVVTQPSRVAPLIATNDVGISGNEVSYYFTEKQTMGLNHNEELTYQCRFVLSDGGILGIAEGTVDVEKQNDVRLLNGN